MKKTILFLMMAVVLASSLVFAEQGMQTGDQAGQVITQVTDAGQEIGQGLMAKVKAGSYVDEQGNSFSVEMGEGDRIRLRARDVESNSELEIEAEQVQERTKLRATLSNGKKAEIKIMPDTASDRALERLRLKVCSLENNCTITLKEVGTGEQARAAYEIQAERHAKILGLFQAKMQVRCQVDAENGEVISVGKPWWAFLATEPAE